MTTRSLFQLCRRASPMLARQRRLQSSSSNTAEEDEIRIARARRIKVMCQGGIILIAAFIIYDFRFAEPPEVIIPAHVRRKRRADELQAADEAEREARDTRTG